MLDEHMCAKHEDGFIEFANCYNSNPKLEGIAIQNDGVPCWTNMITLKPLSYQRLMI